jgi:hypothetical protein
LASRTPRVRSSRPRRADRSTRDLLAFLARNLRCERVLLVVTYRSDETGRARLGPYLAELDRAGPAQRLELPRFARAETQAQLTGILTAAPTTELVEAVFARSEGNPFFTEELLQAMRPGSGALPETLRDLLQGRVEALPEPARQVLRVAAVAGRRVPQGPDRRGGRLEPEDQGDRQDGHGGRPHDVGRDHREAPVHRTDESSLATIEAFQAELREAGPGSVRTFARFMLHLSEEELHELDRRLVAVLDEYIQTDHQCLDRPALGGIVVLHHLADPAARRR